MQTWWKNPQVIGGAAYVVIRSLISTLRVQVHKHPAIDHSKPCLFAFWHGQQLLPIVLHKHHSTPICAMVSPSRDGAMLSVCLQKFGYAIIRGSSRDNNVAALINMKNSLLAGKSVAFGIDGPIGPLHVIKPGIAFLAQKCNVPIIPIGSAYNSNWIFHKAWDKFELPKPFAKAALVLGEPYVVSAEQDTKEACLVLEGRLQQAIMLAGECVRVGTAAHPYTK